MNPYTLRRSSENLMFGFSDDLFASIIFVDRVHATALVLSTKFVAWALPANHSRFQVTCPFIIFVGRTYVMDTESAKTDRKFKYERSSETYIGFSDDFCFQSFSWTESTLRQLCCQQTL